MPDTATPRQQEKCKVIGKKRDEAQHRIAEAPHNPIHERTKQNQIGKVELRRADLEEAVGTFQNVDKRGHRFNEEAQMTQQYQQQRPMKRQCA